MTIVAVPVEPSLPFVRMNSHHIAGFSLKDPDGRMAYKWLFPKMRKEFFDDGRFKEHAVIIDANCWKFPIRDVVNLGNSRNFWDIVLFERRVKVQYLYETPIKLSFEQARQEIVELICSKGWFSKTQDRESEKQFRERMASCDNMRDLIVGRPNTDPKSRKRFQWIGGVSFYGEWVG